ncbi:MAG: protein kinase [Polyangiales bacterium]
MAKRPRVCELCGARYDTDKGTCPLDGAQLRDAPDPLVGLVIGGRYTLEEQIGAGGMGVVYRALSASDDNLVAIKFLDKALARSRSNRERFLREAKAANRIDHEHIINIMNYGETDEGLPYLVMEFLDGVPLNLETHKGAMPIPRALDVALQVAQALARAHELDVVHRDIKPENIFLLSGVGGDFVKVLDFGLASMKGELKLTLTGAVFGTPEYMAPEQCRGERATASVDLYALGAVLYEMLTGTIPYGGNIARMLEQHVRGPVPVPSSVRAEIPRDVDDLVARMMAKAPGDRHRDAHHLVEELTRLLGKAAERERAPTRQPTVTHISSKTVDIEGAWTNRVEEFADWLTVAHPDSVAPPWLIAEVDLLRTLVDEMARVRKELRSANGKLEDRERENRELRLRIGKAIDELGRDESRIAREMDDSRTRLEAARERLEDASAPLRTQWQSLPPAPVDLPAPLEVEKVRDLGHLAAMWLEAQRAVAELAREADARVRERDDLRYQISQLKQRVESVGVGAEVDGASTQELAANLEGRRRALLEDLTTRSEGVYRYFMSVPGFRESIRNLKRVAT